jgi:hypothetical protein
MKYFFAAIVLAILLAGCGDKGTTTTGEPPVKPDQSTDVTQPKPNEGKTDVAAPTKPDGKTDTTVLGKDKGKDKKGEGPVPTGGK